MQEVQAQALQQQARLEALGGAGAAALLGLAGPDSSVAGALEQLEARAHAAEAEAQEREAGRVRRREALRLIEEECVRLAQQMEVRAAVVLAMGRAGQCAGGDNAPVVS